MNKENERRNEKLGNVNWEMKEENKTWKEERRS